MLRPATVPRAAAFAAVRPAARRLGSRVPAPALRTPPVFGKPSPVRGGRKITTRVSAIFERFTEKAVKAVMLAQELGRSCGASEVAPEHILLGLLAQDASKGGFLGCGVGPDAARAVADGFHERGGGRRGGDAPFSAAAKRLFEGALRESRRLGMSFIAPEHVFLALVALDEGEAGSVMAAMGLDARALAAEAVRRLRGEAEGEGARAPAGARAGVGAPARRSGGGGGGDGPKALDEFCADLCAAAAAGRVDPVIGRGAEVKRVAQILARRRKNNPILLGEPGVGKTAIAEGLAQAIVDGALPGGRPLPPFLAGKRVLSLDVGLLIAGAKERGELEARVTRILAECREAGDVVLVIDEAHVLVGAGASQRAGGGGLDVANLLKPALARGELQCIAATTRDEFAKYFEKDAALERRFQPVAVPEPTEAQALAVLEGLAERYERHHRCVYADGALAAAVTLSARYVADRFLPDKAIDLIDEAGSRARIEAHAARRTALGGPGGNAAAGAAYAELEQVLEAKSLAAREGLFEEAALLRARELELKARLAGAPGEAAAVVPVVTVAHIAAVVAAWTGVPAEALSADERAAVAGLPAALAGRVLGQDAAVEAAARAVARGAAGLRDRARPVATLMFAGPTGVGKTELAKALADAQFGGGSGTGAAAMVRLDMSEYMERHSVARLVGAPPGYVGFGEGGKLTEAVRRRPHCVLLFDEIEKAHPDVFNILLQVVEDGRLTDSQGRVVSFKHCLIVITTNVGSAVISKGGAGGVGFELPPPPGADASAAAHSRLRALVLEEMKAYFRPELLNRLDEIVVFRRLGRPELERIAALEIDKTRARAAALGFGLRLTPGVVARVVAEGHSEELGARELRRAVTRLVDDPLAEAALAGRLAPGGGALLRLDARGAVEAVADDGAVTGDAAVELPAVVYSSA